MGMAASQARYLGLTARKTNVEYEGQQINQARTALANQSAGLFNQLLGLTVPTPPSTTDFTKVQYSYKDGTYSETISNMSQLTGDPDYNYVVTHYHMSDIYTGIQSYLNNPQVRTGDVPTKNNIDSTTVAFDAVTGKYSVNGVEVNDYNPADQAQKEAFDKLKEKYPTLDETDMGVYLDAPDGQMHFVTYTDLANSATQATIPDYMVQKGVPTHVGNSEISKYDPGDSEQKAAVDQIKADWPDSTFKKSSDDEIYTWSQGGKTYFGCLTDLMNSANSAKDPTKPTEDQERLIEYNAQNMSKKIETTEKAFVEIGENGRFTSIKYENSSAVFNLSAETITDEAAYKDAMSNYNYQQAKYEKDIQDINAKTEKIQEQDRTLELRLRQLDTEQEALQTEMEAVKKVIDKNIESTFKTFE